MYCKRHLFVPLITTENASLSPLMSITTFFTCSGLKVHVGHEKDMKTSAVNKMNECNKTSTYNIIGNAYTQALQVAEYTSTHQSS